MGNQKFVPEDKLSKKAKKELNKRRRQTWGEMSPVTRKPMNSRAYKRSKKVTVDED